MFFFVFVRSFVHSFFCSFSLSLICVFVTLFVGRCVVCRNVFFSVRLGRGPGVVVSTTAFHARVRGSVPGLFGLKETKMFLPHPRVKLSIVGSLRDREVACAASDRQGSNFESCAWRTVLCQSSHHPQQVFLAQFSLYVHKGGLKPDSFSQSSSFHCSCANLNFCVMCFMGPAMNTEQW